VVGKCRRLPHIGDLGRRLHDPQRPHEVRCVDQRAPALEPAPDEFVIVCREAERAQLDPDPRALQALLLEDRLELPRGVGALDVVPQANVLDSRGAPGLLEIGTAGQQRDRALVGGEDRTLEKNEAAGVEARQVEVALLGEKKDGREPFPPQRRTGPCHPGIELLGREVQRHPTLALP
jgi:hypothetical protein